MVYRSPGKLSRTQPHWVPAADMVMKINGECGATEIDLGRKNWNGVPPHRSRGVLPSGGNHLLVDGSVSWVKPQRMCFLHNWGPTGRRNHNRIVCIYQDPKDFDPQLLQPGVLSSLQFRY